MLNLRVDDLDGMLALMRERGIEIMKVFDPEPNGRFAHIQGPDGMKISSGSRRKTIRTTRIMITAG